MKYLLTPKKKIYRFAIVGPFDIENYGDHLFEHILLQKIEEKFPGSTVDIFSLYSGLHGFETTGKQVYSIDSLEEMHIDKAYSALFIAGGSVIHFHTLKQDVRGVMKKYPIWKLWATASRVASTHGIPLLWNNPEAPFEFKGWERLVAKSFIQTVDYLSVRDKASYESLLSLGGNTPLISDDSGFLFAHYVNQNNLIGTLPAELQSGDTRPIAVFHCNQNLNPNDLKYLVSTLKKVANNFRVILLPLAYTNREQVMLNKLYKASEEDFTFINRTMSFNELCSIFAACSLYMGLSFHGAISTYCSGGEIIAFDYEKRRKTEQLYRRLNKHHNYTTNIQDFNSIVDKHLRRKTSTGNIRIHDIEDNLEKHFSKMLSYIQPSITKKPDDTSAIYSVMLFEMSERDKTEKLIRNLSKGYAECYRQYTELRQQINSDVEG